MPQHQAVSGFSKLSKSEKLKWLKDTFKVDDQSIEDIQTHLHSNPNIQEIYNEFSENTISNFYIPYGLAPNFLINDRWYVIPLAIEESSVVAAASHAAKFWSAYGGFRGEVANNLKVGQVHFHWSGDSTSIFEFFNKRKQELILSLKHLTASMEKRGGGITDIELINKTAELNNYYQLFVKFKTANAMGANFINTVLENLGQSWKSIVVKAVSENALNGSLDINMAILSNYTPECLVKIKIETDVDEMDVFSKDLSGIEFAEKFVQAVNIAVADPYRAVTHNKGIFNGIDGVVIATGNDFRAVEACGHAYAARNGQYASLSSATIDNKIFRFELQLPMAIGTVGGLTSGHPLAKTSLKILQNPDADELMMIIAAAGIANNFSAVRSLITSGIQKGHMKMHLTNMLRQLDVDAKQKKAAIEYFKDKTVSFSELRKFIQG